MRGQEGFRQPPGTVLGLFFCGWYTSPHRGRSTSSARTLLSVDQQTLRITCLLALHHISGALVCRLSQDLAPGLPTANNFLKGASFSPDGTCLLTASDDTVLRVFEVPDHALRGVRDTCILDLCLECRSLILWSHGEQGKAGTGYWHLYNRSTRSTPPPSAQVEHGVSSTAAVVCYCCSMRGLQEKPDASSAGINGAASPANSDTETDWSPCLHSVEGETVYDFAWQVQDI